MGTRPTSKTQKNSKKLKKTTSSIAANLKTASFYIDLQILSDACKKGPQWSLSKTLATETEFKPATFACYQTTEPDMRSAPGQINKFPNSFHLVAGVGFEPTTFGL